MKIEKLNDNQIRCTLTQSDLEVRQLKLNELTYGSPKAKELFSEMMQQAYDEVGFETDNMPIMIEAIPISSEKIEFVITKVDDPDELDTRFSKFAPTLEDLESIEADGASSSKEDILSLYNRIKEASTDFTGQASANNAAAPAEGAVAKKTVLSFDSLKNIIEASHAMTNADKAVSSLYTNDAGRFFLYIDNLTVSKEFAHMLVLLNEYGKAENSSAYSKAYLDEHCKLIIANDALGTLSKM